MRRFRNTTLAALALVLCLSGLSATAHGGDASTSSTVSAAEAGISTIWSEARDAALARAINGDDYECGPTDFDVWIGDQFGAIENWPEFVYIANVYGALNWATYYSLLFDHDASDEYMGINGEQTREMVKRHKDNQRFWDIYSDDILLQGMHGAYMADDAKMIPVVQFLLGVDAADAADIVDEVQAVIEADAGLGYDNPLWTLNAFASSSRGEPVGSPFYGTPDKIVMGDGISEALADLGLGKNGPDFVHAHEFAHHVQYELGVLDSYGGTPEETRSIELMADAFGAYYCAHARGGSFQAKRIVEAFRAAYIIGDCAFANPGHHGTPNQREASSMWGAGVATGAKKQGHIKSSESMLDLFDAELPDLIAPDAGD